MHRTGATAVQYVCLDRRRTGSREPLCSRSDPTRRTRPTRNRSNRSRCTLHQNRVGQILCTLQALAATATLRGAWPRRLIIAGYSVGEVAAWSVAGLMDATMTLDLVSRRANAMDASSRPGDGLLFVRGLPYGAVEDLCNRHDAAIAIVDPGDAFVLGGPGVALDKIGRASGRMGAARAVRLAV